MLPVLLFSNNLQCLSFFFQGQPSGEAFIQMASEVAASQASQNRHNRYMGFGKKQRYIEVLQCSAFTAYHAAYCALFAALKLARQIALKISLKAPFEPF